MCIALFDCMVALFIHLSVAAKEEYSRWDHDNCCWSLGTSTEGYVTVISYISTAIDAPHVEGAVVTCTPRERNEVGNAQSKRENLHPC